MRTKERRGVKAWMNSERKEIKCGAVDGGGQGVKAGIVTRPSVYSSPVVYLDNTSDVDRLV